MNSIYNDALEAQGSHGKPIFLINATLSKSQTFGVSKRVKKEFFCAKKIVAAGTIEQMKEDPHVLLSCLVQILGKQQAFKADRSKYKIEDEIVQVLNEKGVNEPFVKNEGVFVISFHGYSLHK